LKDEDQAMSETDNKPTLGRKPLGLKTSVQAGEVKQTFSHGRTNKVVVEVKRRKLIGKPGEAPVAPPPAPEPAPNAPPRPAATAAAETRQEMQARLLREAEEARLASLEAANRREIEERAKQAELERQRSEAKSAQPASPLPEPETLAPAESAVESAESDDAPANGDVAPAPRRFTPVIPPKRPEPAPKKIVHPRDKTGENRRQSGKLTVSRALNEDEGARARSLAAKRNAVPTSPGSSRRARSRCATLSCPRRSPCRSSPTAWPRRARTSSRRCSRWA
jgi:translation initiation factor IF-2